MNVGFPPVLAAEDEESDALILRLAFERAALPHPLVVVQDGQQIVDYLLGNPPYTKRAIHPLPALLLLDLKMPRMSGFDVLAWLAERSEFKDLPAVILSSSADESDIQKAREMGAHGYFVKPHALPEFVAIVETLRTRWLVVPPPALQSPTRRPRAR